MKILLSVIMPVYNSGKYLSKAVNSILSQSLEDFELILVDDGSTDGSSEKCDCFAKNDPRVVVIHQKNGGICNARNNALKIARGEYVAFSDHDDEYLPGLLEDTYNRAKTDNADLVKFCKKEYIMSDEVVVRTCDTTMDDKTLSGNEIAENYLSLLNKKIIDCVWDSLIKREIITTNAIYFDEFYKAGGEDIDFITRILKHVEVLSLINRCYYLHYIRAGFSTSAKYNPVKLETARYLAKSITEGAMALGIKLEDYKNEYLYQMTFTLLNDSVALLSKNECEMSKGEKKRYLRSLKEETFLPKWFFMESPLHISKISKRYAISYFFFKHNMFSCLLWMSELRNKQLQIKKEVRSNHKI